MTRQWWKPPPPKPDRLDQILTILKQIQAKENEMAEDQARLDSDVQALTAGLDVVEAEIASLKSQPAAAALDFTGLDAAVARLQGDAPAAPAA